MAGVVPAPQASLGIWRPLVPLERRALIAACVALVALVALADYLTGYEVRLGLLHLIPVATLCWIAGPAWGAGASVLATAFWLASFHSSHAYSHVAYHYWDGVVMAATLLLFVLLLTRLRVALENSDARFLRVLEQIQAAVSVTGPAGELLFVNRRHRDLFDRLPAAPALQPEPDPGRAQGAFSSAELRDPLTGRWFLVQQGNILWIDGRAVVMRVLTDLTELKEARESLRRQEDMLHENARLMALAEMASMLAHQLNQPLAAVSGFNAAGTAMLESSPPRVEEAAEAIRRATEEAIRAGQVVRHMRDYARRLKPARARLDLNELVREVVRLAGTEAADAGATLEARYGPAPLPVEADRVMLEQALLNLVRNALQAPASGAGEPRRVVVGAFAGADGCAELRVDDNGAGVPPPARERLFSPFFSTKEGGLGLGLAICRSVAEAHRGRLWHEAPAAGGAGFRMSLPGAAP